MFMDDAGPTSRGYTDCGNFMGPKQCSPGQFCSDATFSECTLGCLSDVNCASNQECIKNGTQLGVCENVVMSTRAVHLRAADAGSAAGTRADVAGGEVYPMSER